MSETLKRNANGVSIILDPLKFRRAGLACALAQWAVENSIEIEESSMDQGFENPANLRLAIFNLGGAGVAEADCARSIGSIRESSPDARIAIISDREESADILAAFRCGANGYIPTSTEPFVALQALSFVLAGGSFFPPNVLLAKDRNIAPKAYPQSEKMHANGVETMFSPSQLRVLNQLKEGQSNKLIARNLRLCEATVKLHVRQIMRKLGASNRTQVAIFCSTADAVENMLRANGASQSAPVDGSGDGAIQFPDGADAESD